MCRIWSVVLAALFCMTVFSLSVSASGIATAVIPVSVEADGSEESYTFQLTALNGAAMPEEDTVVITGTGSAKFVVEYSTVGVYRYTVAQKVSETKSGNYDSTVYYVTVTVQNTDDGGIAATVAAHRGSAQGDKSEIVFEIESEPETEKNTETESAAEPVTELTTDSTESVTSTEATDADSPQTGDDTPTGVWFMAMLTGLVGMLGAFLYRRREQRKKGRP
ncbi:MAG: LPXTG cell wall anchor domain-containing protein [Lachnospiraceae bacterium]|nr:LPXTG cell wall anchor domain-containing protein [Lachnospiraceae bacterium]